MQARAADDLARLVAVGLKETGAGTRRNPHVRHAASSDTGGRRTSGKAARPKRGKTRPKIDAPDKAIEGFLKANGLSREDCEERELERGTFLFAVVETIGSQQR